MARELPLLRGYTDAFGHAQVLGGGVGAMVDLCLNSWDMAATRVLVPEAGGRCEMLPPRGGKGGLVFGAPRWSSSCSAGLRSLCRCAGLTALPAPGTTTSDACRCGTCR